MKSYTTKILPGTYAGIDGGVLYRRGVAGADPGICVRGVPFPSRLPLLPFRLSPSLPPSPPTFPSLPLSSPPLRSIGPLKPARGPGKRCKLPQQGPGNRAPAENEFGAPQSCQKGTGIAIVFSILKSMLRGWRVLLTSERVVLTPHHPSCVRPLSWRWWHTFIGAACPDVSHCR